MAFPAVYFSSVVVVGKLLGDRIQFARLINACGMLAMPAYVTVAKRFGSRPVGRCSEAGDRRAVTIRPLEEQASSWCTSVTEGPGALSPVFLGGNGVVTIEYTNHGRIRDCCSCMRW
jgi:hypothetical protein